MTVTGSRLASLAPPDDHSFEMTGLVLETSAACQLRCPNCALRTFTERPEPEAMPLAVVEAVVPYLAGLASLDLTGWGEPLLNPDLFAIIALIRKSFAGRLTMTTNGLLLDPDRSARLIEFGLDTVCVSLDAAGEDAYRRVRPGGDFRCLITNLRGLARLRGRAVRPYLFATFLLRREALSEVPALVRLVAELGLDGVVLQQLTGVYSERGLAQVTHTGYYRNAFEYSELEGALQAARAEAPPGFMIVGPERICPDRVRGCGGFDLGRPFITASGQVSLCCAMAYPWAHLGRDRTRIQTRGVVFGDVRRRTLADIIRDPAYLSARAEVRSGAVPAACGDCIGLYMRPGEVFTG